MVAQVKQQKPAQKTAVKSKTYTIDCTLPATDKVFDVKEFEQFLRTRIKVDGRVSNFNDSIALRSADNKVVVVAFIDFSGRQLKYLTKKYLKKHELRNWVRVISQNHGNYQLKYFNVVNDS